MDTQVLAVLLLAALGTPLGHCTPLPPDPPYLEFIFSNVYWRLADYYFT